ncbi:Hypothetical predicted protein, partial [Mytilus galloprovincialis]
IMKMTSEINKNKNLLSAEVPMHIEARKEWLKLLYLGYNQITTVEAHSFQTLTALETL